MRFTGSSPISLKVGTLGRPGTRCGAATTIGISRLSLMKGKADGRLSKIIGTWPPTVSFSAGPAPRYGMCVTNVPDRFLYSSICRWPMPPVPDDEYEYLPGDFFSSATND